MRSRCANFSPCYSALVQMNNTEHFVFPGCFCDLPKARSTLELARNAVRLDPVDSRAHLCLGWSQAMLMQYAEASVHVDLACELNGNDPWTLLSAASCQGFCGNFDHGNELLAEALKVSWAPTPLYWPYRAVLQFLRGNYQDAIEGIDRSNNVAKTLGGWKVAALFHLGRTDEAGSRHNGFSTPFARHGTAARRRATSKSPAGCCTRIRSPAARTGNACAMEFTARASRSTAWSIKRGETPYCGCQPQNLIVYSPTRLEWNTSLSVVGRKAEFSISSP